MASRLVAAAVAALAILAGCGGAVGEAEGTRHAPAPADGGWSALYELCWGDETCGCSERCEPSGKYYTCNTGPVRPNGAICASSGTCVNGSCCFVSCDEDALACTRAECTADGNTCNQVVTCPAMPCFGAGGCDGGGNCDYSSSYLGDGAACGTGLWCYEQLCRDGCFIGGQYFDPGAVNSLNPCKVCDPVVSHVTWTDLADGSGCGTGMVCAAGGCVAGCLIDATRRSVGERNPANECQACTATHPDHWADTTDFCTDDGDPCTIDRCAAGSCTHPPNPAACRPSGADSMFGCASGGGAGPLALLFTLALALLPRRRRGPLVAALVAALVAFPTAPAQAAAPTPAKPVTAPRAAPGKNPDAVAIVTFAAGAGVTEETARFVTQAFGAELHARGLSTVSQEDVRAALGFEKERQALGCSTDGCFAELGGTLGVRRLVTGSLARLGDSLVLDAQLVDTRAGSGARRHAVRRPASRGDDAFLESIPELVEALFPPESGAAPRGPLAVALGGWLELDGELGGAGLLLLRWSPTPALRASGGLIATPHRLGAVATFGWIPWNADGNLYPLASLELMLLAADPLSPGVGLSAGVEWRVTPRIDLALEVSVLRLFAVLDGMRETYPFAAVTAAWNL